LICGLGAETTVARVTGGIVRTLELFLDVNFRVNRNVDHEVPQWEIGHEVCQKQTDGAIESKPLVLNDAAEVSDIAQRAPGKLTEVPWRIERRGATKI
jgi:hypothetical protein